MYPRLLQISDQIGRKVSDIGVWNGPIWEWTLKWRRDWFEWEKPIIEEFLQLIQDCIMRIDAQHQWVWTRAVHG